LAANPFRYRGYYYDTESGLYYLNSRYYDPATGRFLNEDAISYLEPKTLGGLNRYAYCLNNPVMYYDPSGYVAIESFVIISVVFFGLLLIGGGTYGIGQNTLTIDDFGNDMYKLGVSIVGSKYNSFSNINDNEKYEIIGAYVFESEHTKNKRPSTENKHQKGQAAKRRNAWGEKGDARRKFHRNGKRTKQFLKTNL